ncbi:uncharacterized protein LOC143861114 isoform X2 [Tasmannia lanceolata]|uniref:uncharacterized protein LOC143861114 isoform X2 n=1 Tax=Tasmannia lanceolata TaxID=3420 RepID=UPI004063F4F9
MDIKRKRNRRLGKRDWRWILHHQLMALQSVQGSSSSCFEGISCLTTLTIIDVSITEDDLERLISSCQLLESLSFYDEFLAEKKLRNVSISMLNLLSLEIHSSMPTHVSLKTAPHLEDVFYKPYHYYNCNEAEMLIDLLMNLGQVENLKLQLFESTAKSLNRIKLPNSLPTLKLKKLTLDVKVSLRRKGLFMKRIGRDVDLLSV